MAGPIFKWTQTVECGSISAGPIGTLKIYIFRSGPDWGCCSVSHCREDNTP